MSDQPNKNIVDFQNLIKGKINEQSHHALKINRSNVFDDSYEQISKAPQSIFLSKFNVKFNEEKGIDVGSLTKEWIVLLMKDIVTKFFTCSPQNSYYPSINASELPNFQDYFEFSGKILALALIHDVSINIRFSTFFLKHILHIPIVLEDLKSYDENLYQSLVYMLNHDPKDLDLCFETSVNTSNGFKDVELIPNGSKIKVTNENKKQYIDVLVNYLLTKSIQQQIDAFCKGFDTLIPHNEIENISDNDLDYLISRSVKIDVNDLIKRIKIAENRSDSKAVQLFLDAISKWSNDDLQKLLMFVTSCYTIPLSGEVFTIDVSPGDQELLPTAHTSFKRLVIPEYTSEEQLNKKFALALNCCDFGII